MVASEDFSDEDFVAVSSCIVLVLAVALAGLSYTGIDIAVSEERHTQDVKPKINKTRSETAAKCFFAITKRSQKINIHEYRTDGCLQHRFRMSVLRK